MSTPRRRPLLAGSLLVAWLTAGPRLFPSPPAPAPDDFRYDPAALELEAARLPAPEDHDAGVAWQGGVPWVAWLRFEPGAGDRLHVAPWRDGAPAAVETPLPDPARLARPTLTAAADGALWLTWEACAPETGWQVFARRRAPDGAWGAPRRLSSGAGPHVDHAAAADADGRLWVAWQRAQEGALDVVLRRADADGPEESLSLPGQGGWAPAIACAPDGAVCVAWDAFTGESFDVLARWRTDAGLGPVRVLAGGPAFEARAAVACDAAGAAWVAWEEGGENWGRTYRSVKELWNNATDARGPLHRFRALRLVRHDRAGARVPAPDPPMPAFARAAARDNLRPGVARLGAYYERPALALDAAGRPWLFHRHYEQPQPGLAEPTRHHVERGWRVQAAVLGADGWRGPLAFDAPQRDGTQRLAVAASADGLAAVWTVGRTDRRADPLPRGAALAVVPAGTLAGTLAGAPPALDAAGAAQAPVAAGASAPRPERAARELGGRRYELFYGDLHRHTDLSLCFPFYDGSLDDAYRYAVEVARLDFLGVTDHTRDIARGDVLGQLWWRCTSEVRKRELGPRFVPFFSFERSHGDTDHNVISVRDDALENWPPPLPEFWSRIDGDTLTIPHDPFIGKVWEHHDEQKRPLVELYQGFRDEASEAAAARGLAKGYRFGFIASSDHLSTSASYAGVWAEAPTREALFRALQARRTFAATDRIELEVTLGERWMGEAAALEGAGELRVRVAGTAPLEAVELWRDGALAAAWQPDGAARRAGVFAVAPPAEGESHVHVRVRQADGGRAWSSPLFVRAAGGERR